MTNIFNKQNHTKDGTLISNWFEERVLRDITGEGRTIPGKHVPKNHKDEIAGIPKAERDNTQVRCVGVDHTFHNKLTSQTYGSHDGAEKKYQKIGIKERLFDQFFQNYAEQEKKEKQKLEEQQQNLRCLYSTKQSSYKEQTPDYSNLGRRIMKTQDEIPAVYPDKLFMANHDMSKLPSVLTEKQIKQYVDNTVPHYKDKEITFWSMNRDKGNMYSTHDQGINMFNRTHGFTQPINCSKSVFQFNQNITNNGTSKNVAYNPEDFKFVEGFLESKRVDSIDHTAENFKRVQDKIVSGCKKMGGWVGLRKLKVYLKNSMKRKTNFLSRTDLKFYFSQFGIFLEDNDIEFIFKKHDPKSKNEIEFYDVLNSFRIVSDKRLALIKNFFDKVRKGKNFVSFKLIEKIYNFDIHPEVNAFLKTTIEVGADYLITWDNLKLNDIVSEPNFNEYFFDVSTCVDNDEDFLQILQGCGC